MVLDNIDYQTRFIKSIEVDGKLYYLGNTLMYYPAEMVNLADRQVRHDPKEVFGATPVFDNLYEVIAARIAKQKSEKKK